MKVRLRIKEIREIKGYSQEYMSKELGISVLSYRNMEKNKSKKCSYVVLFKLKEIFSIDSIDDLFYVDK